MTKSLIRLLAFFSKEINEVRRQPRLVLALILGPFLILVLFGLGYQSVPPRPKAILVLPETVANQVDVNGIKYAVNLSYELVDVTTDENAAMQKLQARQVDVVEVIPADAQARIQRGEAAVVEFRYSEINPITETYIESLSYAQVNEMNKALLVQETMQLQQEARDNQAWVSSVRQELDSLDTNANANDLAQRQENIRHLRDLVKIVAANPLLAAQLTANGENPDQVKNDLSGLSSQLDQLDQSITNRTLSQQAGNLQAVREGAARFETLLKKFADIPPQAIVSPLQPAYKNEQGQALSLATFYAPGVLALILQHIAVTLGALSLVRERLLGAIELFRVAPVSTRQVLIGKYLAYVLFITVIGGVLAGAMFAIQVPFYGSVGAFAAILLLLVIAALGIGFLISAVSRSDTQAVQLSMLVLLVSIFFSGFFLPLENFWLPVRILGYLMPITPSIIALQDVMLRGALPPLWVWVLLGGGALVTFILVNLFSSRQLRFVQG
ncbi:MAG TPA: ABC transporter permease [Anaerolineae bacterium]|nr:ABC transporter permease [Anaerolineae bacterium]